MSDKRLPGVHANHATSRLAQRIFERAIPASWAITSPRQGDDYGIDCELAISRAGQMTAERPRIQIKGTGASVVPSSIRIAVRTLRLLSSTTDLSALIVVHNPTERIWLIPALDHRISRVLDGPRVEVSISLRAEDECGDQVGQWLDILSHRAWLRARNQSPSELWMELVDWPDTASETLREVDQYVPRYLHLSPRPAGPIHTIQARLLYGPPIEVRDTARPGRVLALKAPDEGVVGVATQIALGLYDLGLRRPAAEILIQCIPDVEDVEVLNFSLRMALSEADEPDYGSGDMAPTETLTMDLSTILGMVANELGAPSCFAVARKAHNRGRSWAPQIVAMLNGSGLLPSEFVPDAREILASHRNGSEDWASVASLLMNEGYLAKRQGLVAEAARFLATAGTAHREYLDYGHFWAELGSCLHLMGSAAESLVCYRKALDDKHLPPNTWMLSLHILCAHGDWKRILTAIDERSSMPDPSAGLYELVARYWSQTELPNGPSQMDGAVQVADVYEGTTTFEEAAARAADVVALSPTDPEILVLSSLHFSQSARPQSAFICSLTAALISEGNSELWTDTAALWLALDADDPLRVPDLFTLLLMAPARLLGADHILRLASRLPPELATALERVAVDARATKGSHLRGGGFTHLSARPRERESAIPWVDPVEFTQRELGPEGTSPNCR